MTDTPPQADLEWYSAISRERGVAVRCPFASVHRCPRFYHSLSLLGGSGHTQLDGVTDLQLNERWMKSDLWPVVAEQATSVMSSEETPKIYSRFCPEVSYDAFGLFAEYLSRSGDEIDRELRHAALARVRVSSTDYRWSWTSIVPMHYTECPLYSPLLHSPATPVLIEKKGLLLRLRESRTGKALVVVGSVLAVIAKWGESIRKIWDSISGR